MNEPTIIIDYGMGNLGSIANMIKYLGYKSIITSDIVQIETANKIILPGVGHFDKAMQNISSLGLLKVIQQKAIKDKTPMLGICLGMQLMCNKSEEGNGSGLGLIDAEVRRFSFIGEQTRKIPHMGWNYVEQKKENNFYIDINEKPRFYFVHSYYVACNNESDILTTTNYGHNFVSSFARDNIFGVQFHPEKSHKFGMSLLRNFMEKI
ncbi:MAG: imidazole glycerol phosphate synthase subunit HisH [Bacteroidetes bacterium]|nr:MAG: imidazole glycerol phosphate synthase subunit HisH [Bacteroidota bacterium]